MALVGSGPEEDVMSTINITPFTDVLLVLLIIFMILTSLLKPPPVPEAKNKLKVSPSPIVVIISPKDEIQIGAQIVPKDKIYDAFTAYFDQLNGSQNDIIIKAAPTAKYGTVLTVMDAAKSAGFIEFGLANHIEGTPATSNG